MSFHLHQGSVPLLVSIPHMGTEIPPELRGDYQPRALALEDTDWHLDRLYAFARELGASVLQPTVSRYVVDLNRPPDDTPMYPGASNTELCPTRFFSGDALYREGFALSSQEKARRRGNWWAPYHEALHGELLRLKALHGHVLLWDAHSIRAEIPWLFEGRLPDLNIGTADGKSAHPAIAQAVQEAAARHPQFTQVLNGRFKGGYITRHYGNPGQHVHAVQLEMCQYLYMREAPPWNYEEPAAARIAPVLRDMVEAALQACRRLHG
ncbi:N-formylglutamate deformylase [Ramlibacter solisilvae]|uniref:N-formylglutamate amidohydrolase n=1 Tax=Ramlibacter tataouinensis TaxID=94132 RepID=A0A127JR50_9BURK|nr:N-formylglutamate deformylase [Ramlibacter tataouinensis]AMO22419.1 N-formylglutamate amidohydrolase [Ramlibacter tataouinensis]